MANTQNAQAKLDAITAYLDSIPATSVSAYWEDADDAAFDQGKIELANSLRKILSGDTTVS